MGLLTTSRRQRWRAEKAETPNPKKTLRRQLLLLHLAVIAVFAALTFQLARLQLMRGDEFQQRAENNQLRREPVIPSRGLIYDRNGTAVVENVPGFAAAAVAADVPKSRTLEVAHEIEVLLGVPAIETTLRLEQARRSNDPFTPVILRDGLDNAAAFQLREQLARLPGVAVVVEPVRRYVEGPFLAGVLGYTGRIDEPTYEVVKDQGYLASDRIGVAGVEAAYEKYLRGALGSKDIEKDAAGREVRVLDAREATAGNDLILSLDLDLQKKATELTAAVAKGARAATVVMDVNTGEILSLVSLPMYDDNIFSGKVDEAKLQKYLDDPNKPLVNHALAEQYPPGSIFKQITGAAALEEGVATPSTTIVSNGFISVPNDYDPNVVYTFKDWRVHGALDFYGGVAMSSDVYFYYLAGGYHAYGHNFDGLGIERLARYTRAFGLGAPTGIDIAGEAPGNVPDPAWKEATFGPTDPWNLGDTYHMGIGQGFVTVTPIQMVRATAAIANGGKLLVPRVVREVRDAAGHAVVPAEPRVAAQVPVSAENLAIMREAMRQAVSWGSSKLSAVSGVQVAGKTGTAEYGDQLPDGSYAKSHAWYTGFAPANNPQVAVVVFLEQGIGGNDAAPLASRILDYYFHRPRRAGAAAPPVGQQP